MTTAIQFPAIDCTFGTPASYAPRTHKNAYGNGYEQRVGDGFANLKESWDVRFENISWSEVLEIDAFLEARAGVETFMWSRPDEDPIEVKCKTWSRTKATGNTGSLVAKFEEVVDVSAGSGVVSIPAAKPSFPSIAISFNSRYTVTPRTLENTQGDDYEDRVVDGINTVVRVWSVRWTNISWAECIAINDFLKERQGYRPFLWTPPDETELQVKCEKWSREKTVGNRGNVDATFEQVFDL